VFIKIHSLISEQSNRRDLINAACATQISLMSEDGDMGLS